MSDDILARLRSEVLIANGYGWPDEAQLVREAATEIERLRAALRTSHMQLAAKMTGKIALSDEKHMAILLAALVNT